MFINLQKIKEKNLKKCRKSAQRVQKEKSKVWRRKAQRNTGRTIRIVQDKS